MSRDVVAVHIGGTFNDLLAFDRERGETRNVKVLRKDDTIDFVSNGAGGCGDPLAREPGRVLDEVIDGFMTLEKPHDVYGVMMDVVVAVVPDYRIDEEVTARQREWLRNHCKRPVGYGPGKTHPDGLRTWELLDVDGT